MSFGKKGITALILSCGFLALALTACGSSSATKAQNGNKITAVGSTALQPLVEQASREYQVDHPHVNVNVQGGGSGTGLSQIQQGAVNIGNSDVFASEQPGVNAKELVDHKIAVVGIAPVANKKVGVKNLSMKQLEQIFTGKVTNWKQVGGNNVKIVVINRVEGSGTRTTFEQSVLRGQKAVNAQQQDSNGTVQQIVSSTPGAISYLSFPYLNQKTQEISIDHVTPTDQHVENNDWKIWSYEHMYTKGKPVGTTKDFINYMLSDKVQKRLVKQIGYIQVQNMKFEKNADGHVQKIK